MSPLIYVTVLRPTRANLYLDKTDWDDSSCELRGPEIEHCIGDEGTNPAAENDWSLLPFMALSDGAHLYGTPVFAAWMSNPSGKG